MADLYVGREQTEAKHFILRHYLEELAFKVLRFRDITFVDGFCGPWQTRAGDLSDSSFMIAIKILQDAQARIYEQTGRQRTIRCFFCEKNPDAYKQLKLAVAPFQRADKSFNIETFCGKFEDAVEDIQALIGSSFPLIFIDPTGWTGYPFEKIKSLYLTTKM